MGNQFKSIELKLAREASREIKLPLTCFITLQTICYLQTLSVTFTDSLLFTSNEQEEISQSFRSIISYIEPSYIMNPLDSRTISVVLLCACAFYTIFHYFVVFHVLLALRRKNFVRPIMSKTLALSTTVHSRLLFYPVYCFLCKFLSLYKECKQASGSEETFFCGIYWAVVPTLLILLNIVLAIAKELYGNQIRKNKTDYTLKDNFHPMIILTQKVLIVPLIYLIDLKDALVIFNLLFAMLNIYVLHSRLPFYSLKLLRLSIVFASLTLGLSAILISRLWNYKGTLLVYLLVALPLLVKLSLIVLNITLKRILTLQKVNSCKALHLPIVLKDYIKRVMNFPVQKRFTKGSFYISGFLKESIEDILSSEGKIAMPRVKTEMYRKVADHLFDMLKRNPKNQLLLLYLAQIYISKLRDASKAIYLLNKMKDKSLSVSVSNSIEDIYSQLEKMYLKVNQNQEENSTYFHYFLYKEETLVLKQKIQAEVKLQLKLWKELEKDRIEASEVITTAEEISKLSNNIEQFWNKNFQEIEKKYSNAPLIYGLYLETVQAQSYLGLPIVNNACELLLNKNHVQNDLIDVATGNSAIIIASIEPEKIGKVIDASSSTQHLFGINKDHLKGSSINTVLPHIIAKRHDKFIQQFQKNFKYDFNKQFPSYAKTMSGEYFPVETTLKLYPSVHKGLNIMSFIRKVSNSLPTMIINYEGNIVECSKSCLGMLHLKERSDQTLLSRLCPELLQANHAFNMIYGKKMSESPDQTQIEEEQFVFESQMSPLSQKNRNKTDNINIVYQTPVSSTRELLRGEKQGEDSAKHFIFPSEKTIKTCEGDGFPSTSKSLKKPTFHFSNEEAKEICNTFKEGKILHYISQNYRQEELSFETQIEPYEVKGEFFKIIKLKTIEQKKIKSFIPESLSSKDKVKAPTKTGLEDPFADEFPIAIEKNSELDQKSESIKKKQGNKDNKAYDSFPLDSNGIKDDTDNNDHLFQIEKRKSRTNSIVTSQKSSTRAARQLNTIFRQEKVSYTTRMSIIMVYIAVLAVFASVSVDYVISSQALEDMEEAMNLVDIVNLRTFRSILSWQMALQVFAYSAGLATNLTNALRQKTSLYDLAIDMMENNNLLQSHVDMFNDEKVTLKFFAKTISLWVPYEDVTVDFAQMESFTASRLLVRAYLFVSNYTGDIMDFTSRSEAMFAINNTANDYLLSVQSAANDVEIFFQERKSFNTNLLVVIVVCVIIALLMPFLSILALFRINIKTHKKLFKVISKISRRDIEERINLLESIENHFSENVEDFIIFFNDKKSPESLEKTIVKETGAQYANKTCLFNKLIINMTKYLIFAFLLIVGVALCLVISFIYSLASLSKLDKIHLRVLKAYQFGTDASLIYPSFYFVSLFQNKTEFKINNNSPGEEFSKFILKFENVNNGLVSMFLQNRIADDPVIDEFLNSNMCSYIPEQNLEDCLVVTQSNTFGLLGLNSRFYQEAVLYFQEYLKEPTLEKANLTLRTVGPLLRLLPNVMNSAYEFLAKHYLLSFQENIVEMERFGLGFFFLNLVAIFVTMNLIRIVVLKRYRALDLAPRKIFKTIPYSIIDKNKILSYYLTQEFRHELTDFRGHQ